MILGAGCRGDEKGKRDRCCQRRRFRKGRHRDPKCAAERAVAPFPSSACPSEVTKYAGSFSNEQPSCPVRAGGLSEASVSLVSADSTASMTRTSSGPRSVFEFQSQLFL